MVPLGEPEVDDFPKPDIELREPRLFRDEPSRFGGLNELPPGEPAVPPAFNGENTGTTAEPVLLQDAQVIGMSHSISSVRRQVEVNGAQCVCAGHGLTRPQPPKHRNLEPLQRAWVPDK